MHGVCVCVCVCVRACVRACVCVRVGGGWGSRVLHRSYVKGEAAVRRNGPGRGTARRLETELLTHAQY